MKLRIFRCDNCKKETIPIEEKNTKGEVYPYSLGWVYIYEMEFKINVDNKGRTFKAETDNETLIRMKIGEKVSGDMISDLLEGYSLEITGTSDISGFPGIKGEVGGQLRKLLLKKGNLGMRATRPGGSDR